MFVIIFYEDGAPRVSVNPPRGQISLLDPLPTLREITKNKVSISDRRFVPVAVSRTSFAS